MKKFGSFLAIFCASMLGVLVAFQIEHRSNGNGSSDLALRDLPFASTASLVQSTGGMADFRAAAKKIMPSVVSVDQRVATRDIFSDRVQIETAGTGSGVVISADGLILTNNHVIAGADFVTVRTQEDKTFSAKVVGADPRADLAVIRIKASHLVPAELGDSDRLDVGEWVLAVGNPLGYSNTVSAGVVSSLKRTLPAGESGTLLIDAIQTDAAINPGNSGGALTNERGQVIGINSAIASNTGGSIGVGFAIPINRAKKIVHDIVQYGHVRYGNPGFTIYQRLIQDEDVQDALQRAVGAQPPKAGLVVHDVDPSGPAAKAGIRPLDVVISVDNIPMSNPIQFFKIFADKRPGDTVRLALWDSGNRKTLDLTLEDIASF
jgi:serine protease Do